MKRLLTLLLVLWCSTAWAVEPINLARSNPYVMGSGGAAADSWSCTDADLVCQNFDGSSNSGWSFTTPANTVADEDYANTTALGCNNINVQSLRLTKANAADTVYASKAFAGGTTNTEHYGLVRFKVVTQNLGSGDYGRVLSADAEYGRSAATLRIYNNGGTLELQFGHTTQADSISYDAIGNLSLNTWYVLTWHWKKNQSSGGISASLNGDAITISNTSTADYSAGFILCFMDLYQAGEALYDTIKVNAASAPSCN